MLLVNAKIVDVLNGEISKFDAIRTNDQGEIVDVGASTTLNRNLAKNQEPTIDLDGRYLFPGLISCHTHLSVVFPFSLTDPNEDPAITAFRAAERAHDALHAGITTIRCVHEQNQVDLALRRAALAGWFNGPRILVRAEHYQLRRDMEKAPLAAMPRILMAFIKLQSMN